MKGFLKQKITNWLLTIILGGLTCLLSIFAGYGFFFLSDSAEFGALLIFYLLFMCFNMENWDGATGPN